MPQLDDTPRTLKPYLFHGLDLSYGKNIGGGSQAVGDCFCCGKEKHFFVDIESGQYQCKVCLAEGNIPGFIRQLWEQSFASTNDYTELRKDRKLLSDDTLKSWGVAKSITTGEWLLPAYGNDKKIHNLAVFRYSQSAEKRILQWTSTLGQHAFGLNLFDTKKPEVIITESWNGLALYEVLKHGKFSETAMGNLSKVIYTNGVRDSIYAKTNVVSIGGANALPESLLQLLSDKIVYLLFDNDHAHDKTLANGNIKRILGAGFLGSKRAVNTLLQPSPYYSSPSEIHYLRWGEREGFDPKLPHGYDIRDILTKKSRLLERIPLIEEVYKRIAPVPKEWIEEAEKSNDVSVEPLPCDSWEKLISAWRSAVHMTPGVNRAISIMLAVVASTPLAEDQLWIKLVSPPSTLKTVLCEAISVAKEWIVAKSTIRGLHSGSDAEGSKLIEKVMGKTLIIKDGDTLLQAPNRDQILSELRDAYDGAARTHYRTGTAEDYDSFRMTSIIAGTSALKFLDTTELGARYLDVVIVEEIDDDLEDAICWRAINSVNRARMIEDPKQQKSDEQLLVDRLTGGYVCYLRENIQTLIREVAFSDTNMLKCTRLAKFVSFMRARPSLKQKERSEREMSARLTKQLGKLAICLAVVLNRKEVDAEVMSRVKAVALETSRGVVLNIANTMWHHHEVGVFPQALATKEGMKDEEMRSLLRFLSKIGAVKYTNAHALVQSVRWRMSDKLYALYNEIFAEEIEGHA